MQEPIFNLERIQIKATVVLTLCFGSSLAAITGLPANIQGFASWTVVANKLPSGDEHSGKDKRVYANPVASKAWRQPTAMPVGSLIVKAPGDPKTAKWVAVMQKTSQGWVYQELIARKGCYVLAGESQAECIACHRQVKARDYLFSR